MASYELKISLEGGDAVSTALSGLSTQMNTLKSGGTVFKDVKDKFGGLVVGGLSLEKNHIADIFKACFALGLKGGWNDFVKTDPNLLKGITNSVTGKNFSIGQIVGATAVTMQNQVATKSPKAKNEEFEKEQKELTSKPWGSWDRAVFTNIAKSFKEKRKVWDDAVKKAADDEKGGEKPTQANPMKWWDSLIKRGRAFEAKQEKDAITFKKDMSFLLMPLFNPGSMWATMFSGRQTFSALNTEHGKAFSAKHLGGMGAAGGTALLVGAATVAGLALKGLTEIVKRTAAAYENAAKIYSKALQNGMGLQWSTKRGLLASIMGVSEQDVFRFGAQMAYLNPKLQQASDILAKTATPLTAVSWNFKVLEADLSATWATLANGLAPAVNTILIGLDKLVKGFNTLANSKIFKLIANIAYPEIWALGKFGGQQDINKMPGPQAWMKQLPASHWEHMGLVVGGSQNYQKDISHNTKEIAAGIKILVARMSGKPQNSSWGMSKNTSQP